MPATAAAQDRPDVARHAGRGERQPEAAQDVGGCLAEEEHRDLREDHDDSQAGQEDVPQGGIEGKADGFQ